MPPRQPKQALPSEENESSRSSFEASRPSGYTQVTLTGRGTVWGIPEKFTADSEMGAVANTLLGRVKGCNFANGESDRSSIVYAETEPLVHHQFRVCSGLPYGQQTTTTLAPAYWGPPPRRGSLRWPRPMPTLRARRPAPQSPRTLTVTWHPPTSDTGVLVHAYTVRHKVSGADDSTYIKTKVYPRSVDFGLQVRLHEPQKAGNQRAHRRHAVSRADHYSEHQRRECLGHHRHNPPPKLGTPGGSRLMLEWAGGRSAAPAH